MRHLLIDYENIQPDNIPENQFDVIWLFLGIHQQKHLPLSLTESLQPFGKNVHYVKNQTNSKNALDFLLIFYVGQICNQDAKAEITILSKDSDYDSTISYINHHNLSKIIKLDNNTWEETIKENDPALQNVARLFPIFHTNIVQYLSNTKSTPKTLTSLEKLLKKKFKKAFPECGKPVRKMVI